MQLCLWGLINLLLYQLLHTVPCQIVLPKPNGLGIAMESPPAPGGGLQCKAPTIAK